MHDSRDGPWRMLRGDAHSYRAQTQGESTILSSKWYHLTGNVNGKGAYGREEGACLDLVWHKGKLEKMGMSKEPYRWSINVGRSGSVRQDRGVTPHQEFAAAVSIRKREIKIKITHTWLSWWRSG